MSTEKDVYELDASQALGELKKLGMAHFAFNASAEDGKLKMLAVGAAWAAGTAALAALARGVAATAELLKDSVQAYHEAEQADMKRSRALKSVTGDVEKWNYKLAENASALERLTGVDDEYYAGLQTILLTMGVAPEQIGRFTRAALDLAAATGTDATMAAKLLARAHAEGKDEIKKYGISVDEAAFKARGFGAVLEQVEQRFGGLHTQIPDQTKAMNNLKGAWESFKETLGGTVSNLFDASGVMKFAAGMITTLGSGLRRATNSAATNAWNDLSEKQQQKRMEAEKFGLEEHLNGTKTIWKVWAEDVSDRVALPFDEAQKMLGELEQKLQPKWLKEMSDAGNGQRKTKVHVETDEEKKARETRLKAWQKEQDDKAILFNESASNLFADERMQEAKSETAIRERIAKAGDWEEGAADEYKATQAAKYEETHALAVAAEESRQKLQDAAREKEKAFYADLLSDLSNYAKQALDFVANLVQEQLTQNKTYNDALLNAQVERRVADKQEEELQKKAAELKRELTDEEIAATNKLTEAKYTAADAQTELAAEAKAAESKRTAEFLAGIAKEAGVRAIMEAAEAIASLAKYDYPGAVQHGVAAAAFGAVAVATGVAAASISGSRGMTREEKDNIESLKKRDGEKADRAAKVTEQTGPGTVQNVYFFGISGMTDIGQAAELDRLRRKRDMMSTGVSP